MTPIKSKEERDVVGYEGLYSVTNDGIVYSLPKTWVSGKGSTRTVGKKEMKPGINRGYLTVGLSDGVKSMTHKIHRLVATAFIPNPENKPFINHKNSVRDDNRVSNLEWCTNKENIIHCSKEGRLKNRRLRGKDRVKRKFNPKSLENLEYFENFKIKH